MRARPRTAPDLPPALGVALMAVYQGAATARRGPARRRTSRSRRVGARRDPDACPSGASGRCAARPRRDPRGVPARPGLPDPDAAGRGHQLPDRHPDSIERQRSCRSCSRSRADRAQLGLRAAGRRSGPSSRVSTGSATSFASRRGRPSCSGGRTVACAASSCCSCSSSAFGRRRGPRLAYWQVARGAELRTQARASSWSAARSEPSPSAATSSTGTGRILATTAFRDSLAAYPDLIADDAERAELAGRARRRSWASTRTARASCQAQLERRRPVRGARPRADRRPEPARSATAIERRRPRGTSGPRAAPGARLPAPRRRAGHHARQPAARLRDGRRRGQLRHRAAATTRSSPARPKVVAALRDRSGRPLESSARVVDPGARRAGHPADHRREPPAPAREGALRGVGRRQGQVASARIIMDPDTGADPGLGVGARATTPTTTRRRGRAARAASRTRSSARSTSRAR